MIVVLAACGRTGIYDRGSDGATPMPPGLVSGHVRADVDDFVSVWLNGSLVGQSTERWYQPKEYDVLLKCGQNAVGVEARNEWKTDGLDRGAIFELEVAGALVVSDASWRFSGPGPVDWSTPFFDDSRWGPVTELGAHGIAPWGNVLGASTAQWIWSWDANVPAAAKVDRETVLLRRAFVVPCN